MSTCITIRSVATGMYIGLGDNKIANDLWGITTFADASRTYSHNLKWIITGDFSDISKTTVAHHYTQNSTKQPFWISDRDSININGVNYFELEAASGDHFLPLSFDFINLGTMQHKAIYSIAIHSDNRATLYTDDQFSNKILIRYPADTLKLPTHNELFFIERQ